MNLKKNQRDEILDKVLIKLIPASTDSATWRDVWGGWLTELMLTIFPVLTKWAEIFLVSEVHISEQNDMNLKQLTKITSFISHID